MPTSYGRQSLRLSTTRTALTANQTGLLFEGYRVIERLTVRSCKTQLNKELEWMVAKSASAVQWWHHCKWWCDHDRRSLSPATEWTFSSKSSIDLSAAVATLSSTEDGANLADLAESLLRGLCLLRRKQNSAALWIKRPEKTGTNISCLAVRTIRSAATRAPWPVRIDSRLILANQRP
jgi:hypothetical protein